MTEETISGKKNFEKVTGANIDSVKKGALVLKNIAKNVKDSQNVTSWLKGKDISDDLKKLEQCKIILGNALYSGTKYTDTEKIKECKKFMSLMKEKMTGEQMQPVPNNNRQV